VEWINASFLAAVMYRSPFYMPAAPQAPAANALYYHPQHQHQVPASVMYPRMEVAQDKMIPAAAQHNHHHHRHHPAAGAMYHAAAAGNNASTTPMHVLHFPPAAAVDAGPSRETLQLFPLQPTFLLPADKGRAAGGGASMAPAPSTASASFSGESESLEESPDSYSEALAVPFYDFFGLQSGGR
uniref:Uncharacterized protein n=3 Tax=Setaria TaxID=4554 RepID=A0A0Q3RLD1_SETIT